MHESGCASAIMGIMKQPAVDKICSMQVSEDEEEEGLPSHSIQSLMCTHVCACHVMSGDSAGYAAGGSQRGNVR
jgi:hypothetical protein